MTKTLTLTIAISALNEEGSIALLIRALLSQVEDGFKLTKIVITSDGSTDRTVEVSRSNKSPKVIVKSYSSRKGKAFRLQQIYKSAKTDLIVQFDADISLPSRYVLRDLIAPFVKSQWVGMTGANARPSRPTTYVGRAIYSSYLPYASLRSYCPSLSIGPVLAFRTKLAKQINYPAGLIGEDIYSYFTCLTSGYKYRYAESAVVNYTLPKNLRDHVAQNTRFLQSPSKMEAYFPGELLKREDHIPLHLFIYYMGRAFLAHPILSLYIFIVNFYCKILAKQSAMSSTSNWQVAGSTKITEVGRI